MNSVIVSIVEGINQSFKRRVADIAVDERVESQQQARGILRDAFVRVKQEVYRILSHKVFDVEYGESAIEKAICAAQDATNSHVAQELLAEAPETGAPSPSQADIDAALLETWCDLRWER